MSEQRITIKARQGKGVKKRYAVTLSDTDAGSMTLYLGEREISAFFKQYRSERWKKNTKIAGERLWN